MTAKLVLTAPEGRSLTSVIDMLRHEFPQIYHKLEDKISAEASPAPFGGSGATEFGKIAIDIDIQPDLMKQLDPLLELLLELLSNYTKQEMKATVVIDNGDAISEWSVQPKK